MLTFPLPLDSRPAVSITTGVTQQKLSLGFGTSEAWLTRTQDTYSEFGSLYNGLEKKASSFPTV